MLQPHLRSKPTLPQEPSKTLSEDSIILQRGSRYHYFYDRGISKEEWEEEGYGYHGIDIIKLQEIMDLVPDIDALKQIYITAERQDDYFFIVIKTLKQIPNPYYDEQMKQYHQNMKWYKKDLKQWEKEKETHNQRMIKWKEWKKEQLKKKLEELEKDEKS